MKEKSSVCYSCIHEDVQCLVSTVHAQKTAYYALCNMIHKDMDMDIGTVF